MDIYIVHVFFLQGIKKKPYNQGNISELLMEGKNRIDSNYLAYLNCYILCVAERSRTIRCNIMVMIFTIQYLDSEKD